MADITELLRGGEYEDITGDRPPDDQLRQAADDEAIGAGRVVQSAYDN